VTRPDVAANAWDFGRESVTVGPQSVLQLEVQFPGGIDSPINPGEFFVTGVGVDFRE